MTEPGLSLFWWLPEYPPDPGGISTFAGHLVPGLAGRGYPVHALITQRGPEVTEVGERCTLHREPVREAFESGDPMQIAQLRPMVRRAKEAVTPDVYHVHLCEPSPFLHLATIDAAPAPTVLTIHNELIAGFDPEHPDGLATRLFAASRIVTCVSSTATTAFTTMVPHHAHRIVPIPNGAPVPADTTAVPDTPHLVAVGRLKPQKGFDRLLAAMPSVVQAVPDVHLDILGEGPERPRLEAMIETLGLSRHVRLHGEVERSQVGRSLDRARVFVMPSRFEGLPYAALEAAGHGRPIVATNVAGTDEVVVDGETGVLVDNEQLERRPEVLADAVIALLTDHGACDRMGRAGRDRTIRLFSLDRCLDAYEHVYRAAAQPRRELAIVIPVHNGERHLAASIESALAAITHAGVDAQVLVVDDGSTDGSAAIARRYRTSGVEVFSQPNLGPGMARNTGTALTHSEWIAHLDADDLWPADRLTRLLETASESEAVGNPADAVFGHAVQFADPDAPASARVITTPAPVRMETAAIVRRSTYDTVGGHAAERINDQVDWSTRATAAGTRWVPTDAVVLERRIHAGNRSHVRPFVDDRSRVALMKAHLDRLRQR